MFGIFHSSSRNPVLAQPSVLARLSTLQERQTEVSSLEFKVLRAFAKINPSLTSPYVFDPQKKAPSIVKERYIESGIPRVFEHQNRSIGKVISLTQDTILKYSEENQDYSLATEYALLIEDPCVRCSQLLEIAQNHLNTNDQNRFSNAERILSEVNQTFNSIIGDYNKCIILIKKAQVLRILNRHFTRQQALIEAENYASRLNRFEPIKQCDVLLQIVDEYTYTQNLHNEALRVLRLIHSIADREFWYKK